MAALVGALRVTLGANTANYEAGMRRAQTTARRTGRDISSSLSGAQRMAVNAFRGIAAAAGVASVGAGALTFLRYADAAKQLEAQLRLATAQSGSFAQAQADVSRISRETRSSVEGVANLYAVFQRNAHELGITQREAAQLTETVTQTFLISGATAAEASGGLRQFIQGLQSGTLRGEEFNSVMENAPRLARALSDSLGVPIGQLRAMAEAGLLSGETVTRAVLDASAKIDAEFAQLPVTFDQAMTLVRNAAIETFGAFDRGGQFSQMIAEFFVQESEGFAGMANDAERAGADIRSTLAALSDVFSPMVGGAERDFGIIAGMADSLREAINAVLSDLQWAYNQYVSVANAVDNFGASVLNPAMRLFSPGVPPGGVFAPGTRGNATFGDDFARRQANEFRARSSNAGIIGAAQEQLRPRSARTPVRSGGGGGGRRRRGGGGRTRAARPAQRIDPNDVGPSPYLEGPSVAEMDTMSAELEAARRTAIDLSDIVQNIPTLGDLITQQQREDMLSFTQAFREDLAGGLAQAVVYGRDLGDALVDSLKRAAAALLESSLLQLMGGGGGMSGGAGILGSLVSGIFGRPAVGTIPKFASGGSFRVGGSPGIDRNVLSLNDSPVAMVSRGETVGVGWGGGGGKVEIILRDNLLDARIVEGAGFAITRAYPAMKADMQASQSQSQRRR